MANNGMKKGISKILIKKKMKKRGKRVLGGVKMKKESFEE